MADPLMLQRAEERAQERAATDTFPGRRYWLWWAKSHRTARLREELRRISPRRASWVAPLPVREVDREEP